MERVLARAKKLKAGDPLDNRHRIDHNYYGPRPPLGSNGGETIRIGTSDESLSASNAELAHDLRREIRSQIAAGKSDGEIREFMVSRYGDFVLYRPPLKGTTLLLWFGPALFFAVGLVALIRYLRRRNLAIKDAPLSADEQAELDRLLSAKDPKD